MLVEKRKGALVDADVQNVDADVEIEVEVDGEVEGGAEAEVG